MVTGGNGNSCETYTLLDDGADKTLCDERLLRALNADSRQVTFNISTVNSTGCVTHGQEVDLQSKKISNDQELMQSDPISCPQNQKGSSAREQH